MQLVNRIFCIGRNYSDHVKELGNTPDESCVIFLKPASCIVPVGIPIDLPSDIGSIHHEAELVVQLSGGGKNIAEDSALQYVQSITVGLDLTARDLQNQLKAKGHPWERAKAFDGASPLGAWTPYDPALNLQDLHFTCRVNGQLRQQGHTAEMMFPIARQIAILSNIWSLQANDVIYTGTPAGVGPLQTGDHIEVFCQQTGHFVWHCR